MSTNTIFDYKQKNIETEQLGKVYVLQCGSLHNAVYAVKHPVKVLKNMRVNDSTPAYSKFFKSFDDAIKKYKKDFTNKLNDKDLNSIKRKHIQIVYDGTKGKDINPKCKTIIRRGRYWYAVYLQDNNVSRDLIVGGEKRKRNDEHDGLMRENEELNKLIESDKIKCIYSKRLISLLYPTSIIEDKLLTYWKNKSETTPRNSEDQQHLEQLEETFKELKETQKQTSEELISTDCDMMSVEEQLERIYTTYYQNLKNEIMKLEETANESEKLELQNILKNFPDKAESEMQTNRNSQNTEEFNKKLSNELKQLYVLDSVHDVFDRKTFQEVKMGFANEIFEKNEKNTITPQKFIDGLFHGNDNVFDSNILKDSINLTHDNITKRTQDIFWGVGTDSEHPNASTNFEMGGRMETRQTNKLAPIPDKSSKNFTYIKNNLHKYLMIRRDLPGASLTNKCLSGSSEPEDIDSNNDMLIDINKIVKLLKDYQTINKEPMGVSIDAIKGSFQKTSSDQLKPLEAAQKNNKSIVENATRILTPAMLIDPATTPSEHKYKFLMVNFKIKKVTDSVQDLRNEHLRISFEFKETQLITEFEIEMFFFKAKLSTPANNERYDEIYSELENLGNQTVNYHAFDIPTLKVFDENVFLKVMPKWYKPQNAPNYLRDLIICNMINKNKRNSYAEYLNSTSRRADFKPSWNGLSFDECLTNIFTYSHNQSPKNIYLYNLKVNTDVQNMKMRNLRHMWLHFLDWKRMGDSMQISYIKEYYLMIGKQTEDNFPMVIFASQDILACCIAIVRRIPVLFNTGASTKYHLHFPVSLYNNTTSVFCKKNPTDSDCAQLKNKQNVYEQNYLEFINKSIGDICVSQSRSPSRMVQNSFRNTYIDKVVDDYLKFKCSIYKSFSCLDEAIQFNTPLLGYGTHGDEYDEKLKQDHKKFSNNVFQLIKGDFKYMVDAMNKIKLTGGQMKRELTAEEIGSDVEKMVNIDFDLIKVELMNSTKLNPEYESLGIGVLEHLCEGLMSVDCNKETISMELDGNAHQDIKDTEKMANINGETIRDFFKKLINQDIVTDAN